MPDDLRVLGCIACALHHELDDPNEEGGYPPRGIYVVNGQSVCEGHIAAPYRYPEHGLGGMEARMRRDRFNDAIDRDAAG